MAIAIDRSGEGPALALLHGVGTNRAIWHRAAPLLAASHTVLAPDLPGFGDSSPTGPGFELTAVADVLAEALAEQAGGPFDLVGHSLGGAIALVLADRHPRRVRRLVLSAPAGFTPRSRPVAEAAGALARAVVAARRVIGTPLAGSPLARRTLLAGAIHDASRLGADDARLMLGASRGASRFGAAVREVAGTDLRTELARLPAPVGAIWGERDAIIPPRTVDVLRECAGELPVETIPGAGHVSQIERPREFAAALERLLEQLSAITD